jgi:hypothetical protein
MCVYCQTGCISSTILNRQDQNAVKYKYLINQHSQSTDETNGDADENVADDGADDDEQ